MPKIWATQNNLQFAYYTSGVIELIHLLFRRVGGWAVQRSEGLERVLGGSKSALSPQQLERQIDQVTKNDASDEERNILKGLLDFGSITVKQVMRTRLEVCGVSLRSRFRRA